MNRAGANTWALVVLLLAASAFAQVGVDRRMASYRDAPAVLWLNSGKVLKRLSLGHDGLLADIYWTRAVQYYGGQRRDNKTDFSLLAPLLNITVDLDPNLLIAYNFGASFLAEPSPRGANQPEEAVRLIKKGIQANPDHWRFWHELGFIYYQQLKNYPAAAAAYMEGSKNPQADVWMKVMAAVITQKGGNRDTSRFLWAEIYRSTEDPSILANAFEHLQGLQAADDLDELGKRVSLFHDRTGRWPRSFSELVEQGILKRIPVDPKGVPYKIDPGGKVELNPESTIKLE
jgi:tetratricopeptide (TPR) repeat protein